VCATSNDGHFAPDNNVIIGGTLFGTADFGDGVTLCA
jgi:hypothetical protein